MLAYNIALTAALLFNVAVAVPVALNKRIDQTITDAISPWEQACNTAGGTKDTCSNIGVTAAQTLLEAAGNCDQQNSADAMIDLAKQLNNDAEMIRLAQVFVQQPRNSPSKDQVPYCQVAPKNAELNGLFHCQFAGSDFSTFSGDQTGNVPLGLQSLNPAGSCPANPTGPVPDGEQLNTLVTAPIAASTSVVTVATTAATTQVSASSAVVPTVAAVIAPPEASAVPAAGLSCSAPA